MFNCSFNGALGATSRQEYSLFVWAVVEHVRWFYNCSKWVEEDAAMIQWGISSKDYFDTKEMKEIIDMKRKSVYLFELMVLR